MAKRKFRTKWLYDSYMAGCPRRLGLPFAATGFLLVAPALWSQESSRIPIHAPSAPPQKPVDTTEWKILVNGHGWSVRYPHSWQAVAVEANSAKEEFQPILSGPKGCYEQGQECGFVQLGSGWRLPTPHQAGLSAKEDLLEGLPSDHYHILLQQGNTVLGGQPAYFVVYRLKLYVDYPNGVIFRKIETKYRNQFYFIVFNEEGKHRAVISSMNSPDDWALNPIFEAIVASFRLTGK